MFDPEIEWNECPGFPYVSGDGQYIGPEAVTQHIFAQLPEYFDGFRIDIGEIFGDGDKVVMAGHYGGRWKPTGKEFRANATHVWTVQDGKLKRFFQAADTATIINP